MGCAVRIHNRFSQRRFSQRAYGEALSQAMAASQRESDISDHINDLFFFASLIKPRLLVELGTRSGESTRGLLGAAAQNNAILLSIDIEDCSNVAIPERYRGHWHFVQADDVIFAVSGFAEFCRKRRLEPLADLIFIDTSHLYEHTRAELAAWAPLLRERGLLVFHDTNLRERYVRLDNSWGLGWNNQRGVIRAIEDFLGRHYEENAAFSDCVDGWLVRHVPYCNGLTILQRQ